MNKELSSHNRGFIEIILLVVIALAALKYFFDFSIFEFFGSPEGQGTLYYIKELLAWMKTAVLAIWAYIQ